MMPALPTKKRRLCNKNRKNSILKIYYISSKLRISNINRDLASSCRNVSQICVVFVGKLA